MERTSPLLIAAMVGMLFASGVVAFGRPDEVKAALPAEPGIIVFQGHTNSLENTNPEWDNEIFTMNPDGSGVRQLTINSVGDINPGISPDGTKIAFASFRDGNWEIYSMNADGTGQTRLTNDAASDSDPAFTPDGKKVIFRTDRDGNSEIYSMNADGSGTPKNLTNDGAEDLKPSVSPNGRKIAFVKRGLDESSGSWYEGIYVMKVDGSGQTKLTGQPAGGQIIRDYQSPDFSPDGKTIAFSMYDGSIGSFDIYLMSADGSNLTNLTEGYPTWPRSDTYPMNPNFSPDGTKIAFTTATEVVDRQGPYMNIYVMNSDGSGQTQITTNTTYGRGDVVSWGEDLWWDLDWQPNTAPFVEPLRPAPGSLSADRTPHISARVKDAQEELAKSDITKLSLDGTTVRRIAFAYDSSTDRLSYTPSSALSYGRHTVRVVARDSVGAATTKAWSFSVVR